MNPSPKNDLEGFIHEQLRKLPERGAPADLAGDVLRAIAAREASPWWRQPFTEWPGAVRNALYFALAVLVSAVLWLVWKPAEHLTLFALLERAQSLPWLAALGDALFKPVAILRQNMGWMSLAIGAFIFGMMYTSCVVSGLALWRVTHPRRIQEPV